MSLNWEKIYSTFEGRFDPTGKTCGDCGQKCCGGGRAYVPCIEDLKLAPLLFPGEVSLFVKEHPEALVFLVDGTVRYCHSGLCSTPHGRCFEQRPFYCRIMPFVPHMFSMNYDEIDFTLVVSSYFHWFQMQGTCEFGSCERLDPKTMEKAVEVWKEVLRDKQCRVAFRKFFVDGIRMEGDGPWEMG